MNQFLGIVRYEYRMSTRRWGMWLAFGLIFLFYAVSFLTTSDELPPITSQAAWTYAGQMGFFLNLFMPVVGGIIAADRLWRDTRLGVAELQHSAPIRRWPYLLGKYVGVLLSILTPPFLSLLLLGSILTQYGVPFVLLPYTLVAFLAITVPAYAFITAFSLACPLVMPLRVYQVLFTGYWFWGNFLNPRAFPSISDTLLVPCGRYAYEGFFSGAVSIDTPHYTAQDATLNLLVLALCIVVALVALERYLAWREHHA